MKLTERLLLSTCIQPVDTNLYGCTELYTDIQLQMRLFHKDEIEMKKEKNVEVTRNQFFHPFAVYIEKTAREQNETFHFCFAFFCFFFPNGKFSFDRHFEMQCIDKCHRIGTDLQTGTEQLKSRRKKSKQI